MTDDFLDPRELQERAARRRQRREEQRRRVRRQRRLAGAVVVVLAVAAVATALSSLGGSGGTPGASAASRSRPRGAGWKPYTGPVPILEYHVLGRPKAEVAYPELYVPRAAFRKQMDWLERQGYEAVTLEGSRRPGTTAASCRRDRS
ncbi:MAG TPA: hypothetical protein VNN15_06450 [Solirubrobacterales bacterium]|nr:hypothetical protein [Solirubrobacterales bacterium]